MHPENGAPVTLFAVTPQKVDAFAPFAYKEISLSGYFAGHQQISIFLTFAGRIRPPLGGFPPARSVPRPFGRVDYGCDILVDRCCCAGEAPKQTS
jgi:hypothetical protein